VRFVLAGLLLVLILSPASAEAARSCRSGTAQGFVVIRSDPEYLVGTIPSTFRSNPIYFQRRYNCRHRSAYVRRVDLGVYEVRFPGLSRRVPQATAISQEGISASAQAFGDVYRVTLRGPYTLDASRDILARRDVPFALVIF